MLSKTQFINVLSNLVAINQTNSTPPSESSPPPPSEKALIDKFGAIMFLYLPLMTFYWLPTNILAAGLDA